MSVTPVTPEKVTLEKIVSLCKRRGFVYPSAEIYGGINGVYDFGPLGAVLRKTLKMAWLNHMQSFPEDVVEFEGALLGPADVWKASGHLDNFSDPMVDCLSCKRRFRSDDGSVSLDEPCPHCKVKSWTAVKQFNLMFETNLGATGAQSAFLRPETAQAIFVNFKNIIQSTRVSLPFGVAQIGKSFRNEITPKQFIFRVREFEQMEMEFFCDPADANAFFITWRERQQLFYRTLGLQESHVRMRDHDTDELAHYSHACTDVEFLFPFGWKELEGIAHRSTYDLTQHSTAAHTDLSMPLPTGGKIMPAVVECSVGVDRLFFAVLSNAYREEILPDGDIRVVLSLAPHIAPVQVAVFPLVKKLDAGATALFAQLRAAGLRTEYDEKGSIGKRYRRADEIGIPFCITYDFESETDMCVTIRNRDTQGQERISIQDVPTYLTQQCRRVQ